MINDNFINGIASLLAGSTYTIPSYLAFGSTTTTLTTTDVYTPEEFDRNVLDSKGVSTNVVRYIGSRLSTEAHNELICDIALVNSATLRGSYDIQSSFLVSSLTHSTSFDISVEYWFTINRG
jgi:hypothetical protein